MTSPLTADTMYRDAYFAVQRVLDGALGEKDEDGAGGGIAGDVFLLAEQRDTARAEVTRLTALITAPDGGGIPAPLLLEMLAMANHAEGLDVADYELLDHPRTETYRMVAESVWSVAREQVEELRTELAETRGVAAMNWDASAYHHGEWVRASAQRDEAWAWLSYEMRCTLTAKWAEQSAAVSAAPVPAPADEHPADGHPAYAVLFELYRRHDCPGTVDPLDPEDCAGVAAESVRALLDAGLLVAHEPVYYCPTSGETESPTHGGFDVCCDKPELHTAAPVVAEATQAEVTPFCSVDGCDWAASDGPTCGWHAAPDAVPAAADGGVA